MERTIQFHRPCGSQLRVHADSGDGEILSRKAQEGKSSRSQSLYNLKYAELLTANKIVDMAGLGEKFKSIIGERFDIRDKRKPVDRRRQKLAEHIKYSGNFKAYRSQKMQYDKLYAQHKILKKKRVLVQSESHSI